MNIWLITIGENLPLPGVTNRMLRTGVLAECLQDQGHSVTWWSSTMNHMQKRHWYEKDTEVPVGENYRLLLLHGAGYERNVSPKRLLNHFQIARSFERWAARESVPDVIFCSLPTIELSVAAVNYAKANRVPIALDIRDLWPDAIVDLVPPWARPLSQLALYPQAQQAKSALRRADGLVGISESYLEWGLQNAGRARQEMDRIIPLGYRKVSPSARKVEAAWKELTDQGVSTCLPLCWFVGTFGRTYDLVTVLEAARQLEASKTPVQFVLSGTGEDEAVLKARAKGLSNVVFTGWMGAEKIAAMGQKSHLGLMAYAKGAPQSLPNKLFEYLSYGLPILSSLHGETGELLKKNGCGMTYSSGDPSSLSSVVQDMIANPNKPREMGQRGLTLFSKEFSEEIVYGKLGDYLQGLIAKK